MYVRMMVHAQTCATLKKFETDQEGSLSSRRREGISYSLDKNLLVTQSNHLNLCTWPTADLKDYIKLMVMINKSNLRVRISPAEFRMIAV